jgi:predicted component of type VI protein secretion system
MQPKGRYRLAVRQGPVPGKFYELAKDVSTLGRDVRNDIVVNDAEVSRTHCRLTAQADGYLVEDLGSTNGTFIAGQRLTGPRVLRPGERLGLGETVVLELELVRDPEATVIAEPSATPAAASAPSGAPAPQPTPAYAPESEAEAEPQPRRKWLPWVAAGCGCLSLCACVSFAALAWVIDANDLWCQVLPFLPNCP